VSVRERKLVIMTAIVVPEDVDCEASGSPWPLFPWMPRYIVVADMKALAANTASVLRTDPALGLSHC